MCPGIKIGPCDTRPHTGLMPTIGISNTADRTDSRIGRMREGETELIIEKRGEVRLSAA